MDERVRNALTRELSRAEFRVDAGKEQIERLEAEMVQARADLAKAEDDALAFRETLAVHSHAHTIDKFSGTLVVPASTSSYSPDRDAFSETETARMMGVV